MTDKKFFILICTFKKKDKNCHMVFFFYYNYMSESVAMGNFFYLTAKSLPSNFAEFKKETSFSLENKT